MALDRQSIQRKDFPIARRGYDPAAVDAHLAAVADELAAAQAASQGGGTLASSASDHVRAIIDAAETSAAQIRRDAESEADATRDGAVRRARELAASTDAMLARLEETRRELDRVIESLRSGVGALEGDLGPAERDLGPAEGERAALAAQAADNGAGADPEEPAVATESERVAAMPAESAESDAVAAEPPAVAAGPPAAAADPVAPADGPAAAATSTAGADDSEGARLIALNMALDGRSREEIGRYLAEHFTLHDREGLLDEVYASVEG